MVYFLKSSSTRRVNDVKHCEEECKEYYYKGGTTEIVGDYKNGGRTSSSSSSSSSSSPSCISATTSSSLLTVWRKSLLMSCSGFTVIDCRGNLVYRVDNYRGKPSEVVLMDASGSPLFTMRRHMTLRLVDDWLVYKGEASDQDSKTCQKKQPICYVKKNVSLLQSNSNNVLAHVLLGTSSNNKNPTFVIEGCYGQRSCKVFDKSSKNIVAEIKKKEAVNGSASFGVEVFHLIVCSGFDSGFAMALVLLLDQMFS